MINETRKTIDTRNDEIQNTVQFFGAHPGKSVFKKNWSARRMPTGWYKGATTLEPTEQKVTSLSHYNWIGTKVPRALSRGVGHAYDGAAFVADHTVGELGRQTVGRLVNKADNALHHKELNRSDKMDGHAAKVLRGFDMAGLGHLIGSPGFLHRYVTGLLSAKECFGLNLTGGDKTIIQQVATDTEANAKQLQQLFFGVRPKNADDKYALIRDYYNTKESNKGDGIVDAIAAKKALLEGDGKKQKAITLEEWTVLKLVEKDQGLPKGSLVNLTYGIEAGVDQIAARIDRVKRQFVIEGDEEKGANVAKALKAAQAKYLLGGQSQLAKADRVASEIGAEATGSTLPLVTLTEEGVSDTGSTTSTAQPQPLVLVEKAVRKAFDHFGLKAGEAADTLWQGVEHDLNAGVSVRAALQKMEDKLQHQGALQRNIQERMDKNVGLTYERAFLMEMYTWFHALSQAGTSESTLKYLKKRIHWFAEVHGLPRLIVNLNKWRQYQSEKWTSEAQNAAIKAIDPDTEKTYAVIEAGSALNRDVMTAAETAGTDDSIAFDEGYGQEIVDAKGRRRKKKKKVSMASWIFTVLVAFGEGVLPMFMIASAAGGITPLAIIVGVCGTFTNFILFKGSSLNTLSQWFLTGKGVSNGWRYNSKGELIPGWKPKAALIASISFCVGFGVVYGILSFSASSNVLATLIVGSAMFPHALAAVIAIATGVSLATLFATTTIRLVNEGEFGKIWANFKTKYFSLPPMWDTYSVKQKVAHLVHTVLHAALMVGAMFISLMATYACCGMYLKNFNKVFMGEFKVSAAVTRGLAIALVGVLSFPINILFNGYFITDVIHKTFNTAVDAAKLGQWAIHKGLKSALRVVSLGHFGQGSIHSPAVVARGKVWVANLKTSVRFKFYQILRGIFCGVFFAATGMNAYGQAVGCENKYSAEIIRQGGLAYLSNAQAELLSGVAQFLSSAGPVVDSGLSVSNSAIPTADADVMPTWGLETTAGLESGDVATLLEDSLPASVTAKASADKREEASAVQPTKRRVSVSDVMSQSRWHNPGAGTGDQVAVPNDFTVLQQPAVSAGGAS